MNARIFWIPFAVGCHHPGPYGHAIEYVPLSEEAQQEPGAREYDPVMAPRDLEAWSSGTTWLFGIVDQVGTTKSGALSAKVDVVRREPRNACINDKDEDTCRVTVSARKFGRVVLTIPTGKGAGIEVGGLVRVFGVVKREVDPEDGAPELLVRYLRHWPMHYFETRGLP